MSFLVCGTCGHLDSEHHPRCVQSGCKCKLFTSAPDFGDLRGSVVTESVKMSLTTDVDGRPAVRAEEAPAPDGSMLSRLRMRIAGKPESEKPAELGKEQASSARDAWDYIKRLGVPDRNELR